LFPKMLSASAPSKLPEDHFTIPKKFAGLILSVLISRERPRLVAGIAFRRIRKL
jgi:hypothetical protein